VPGGQEVSVSDGVCGCPGGELDDEAAEYGDGDALWAV